MDSLTLFGHLFKTPCEAICIFLDFFTEKRGSHREIYDFFRKSHETHCIRKRFSIYCNKNCSGNMRILCPFAEITYTPPGDENLLAIASRDKPALEITFTPPGDENNARSFTSNNIFRKQLTPRQGTKTQFLAHSGYFHNETTYTPPGDENLSLHSFFQHHQ